jgi:hypothetical protein
MRLTLLEQEFAVWVNTRLRMMGNVDGQRLCVDAAQILGNQAGFRDRRRAFFALCIKGVAGAENWLEILDSGNVKPTFVGMTRRLINPDIASVHVPRIYDEPMGAW